ncbi:sugar kinase [Novosphingobium sp. ERN07]|nr:sugar kinase [Novosphingobium sp. ERN07]
MLELSQDGPGWHLGYGGDTLNSAIHLARAGLETAYLTALGTDPFSADLKARWAAEGLDTSLVLTDPVRNPGLYAISCDAAGERSFTYWRGESAARHMFDRDGIDQALAHAAQADILGFSLITIAILPEAGRNALFDLARTVADRGNMVVFDGNYRPRLWPDHAEAQHWRDAAIAVATVGLPTLDDESALSGQTSADQVARHWTDLGCREVVVKMGAAGARTPDGTLLAPPKVLKPVDTSGAGDAFNGGFLAARAGGASMAESVMAGHRLAGWCVMNRGAIPLPFQPENSE